MEKPHLANFNLNLLKTDFPTRESVKSFLKMTTRLVYTIAEHEKSWLCEAMSCQPVETKQGVLVETKQGVLAEQAGGNHYKDMPIEPWQIINALGLGFYAGTALKYLMRYKVKGGAVDIEKAIHYLKAVLEFEYGKQPKD
jgi:hypothetical protein